MRDLSCAYNMIAMVIKISEWFVEGDIHHSVHSVVLPSLCKLQKSPFSTGTV